MKNEPDRRSILLGAAASAAILAGCSKQPPMPTRPYDGPMADGIVVRKGQRRMFLLNGTKILSEHEVDLGFAPEGHKIKEGDGRTPEGQYFIDRRNRASAFYLSLGISYPNRRDRARAAQMGVDPGGDIFIHGQSKDKSKRGRPDWTAGCIAIPDWEMYRVFQMVPLGTPIWIEA